MIKILLKSRGRPKQNRVASKMSGSERRVLYFSFLLFHILPLRPLIGWYIRELAFFWFLSA
jgi:hypothetical protein